LHSIRYINIPLRFSSAVPDIVYFADLADAQIPNCYSVSSVKIPKRVEMSDRSTPEADSLAPTTAPSSPPDLPSSDKIYTGLEDDEIRKLKEEDRKARDANKKEDLKRQKALAIKRKKARQESAADREAKARQLESLLAKSAVCSKLATSMHKR
jgi:hypothetical protein